MYLHFRDALALAKYVVVQRLLALQRAEELLWNETLRLRDAQVVHEAFLDDLQDSFTAQNLQAVLHAAADLDLSMAEGRNELASSFALSAGKNFTESQATLDVIMAERDEALEKRERDLKPGGLRSCWPSRCIQQGGGRSGLGQEEAEWQDAKGFRAFP